MLRVSFVTLSTTVSETKGSAVVTGSALGGQLLPSYLVDVKKVIYFEENELAH